MGVAGSGKSSVGSGVARHLGWPFQEGDLLHPAANVAKMAAGAPLTDDDRLPWLARVRGWIEDHANGVITCSALKRSYRDVLRDEHVRFVYLAAPREVLYARLSARTGHFMPATLLDSQLRDLEPPDADEEALRIDATAPIDEQITQILAAVRPIPRDDPVPRRQLGAGQNRGADDSSQDTKPV
jgi:carbohydrate kinase (thermoresistant glucokinase family)